MPNLVRRPLWKLFGAHQKAAALKHARAGGIAVLTTRTWSLFAMGEDAAGKLPDMTDWAIHAIKSPWYVQEYEGDAAGLVHAPVLKRYRDWAKEWAARDASFKGSVQRVAIDCTSCAACCYDNRVLLSREDLERWKRAGRSELARRTVAFRNRRRLPLLKESRACIHLKGSRCGIYAVRPDMCREFLPGTEHCMAAREQKFGTGLF